MLRLILLILILSTVSKTNQAGVIDPDKDVQRIHKKALTVDTHCDTPMKLLDSTFDIGIKNKPPQSRVDFPRMKEGGLDAMFFAAFTGQRPRTPDNTQEAYKMANDMIDAIYGACTKYSEMASVAVSSKEAPKYEQAGKLAIYIGMENGFPIGTDLSRIKEFYDKGVRYITLCHSYNNDICDSSTDKKGAEHNGLSPFGKNVVKEMNRLGMIVDVSHISDKAFYDVIATSKAPIIASHSSVRAIAKHPRNMTDDMIKALAKNGGVIQICLLDEYIKDPDTTSVYYQKRKEFYSNYEARSASLTEEQKKELRREWRSLSEKYPNPLPNVSDFVDHIDHVKKLVGIDYVGIGSDFDGGGGVDGCADVSQFPNITAEMLRRGYTEDEIIKVWGGNFYRVFAGVEKLAQQ
jgi:membrane dipeptidase